jgi:IMP dehydrogenase
MNIVERGYDYDDLLLVPMLSFVDSGLDVDLRVNFCREGVVPISMEVPIFSSPMKDIYSREFAFEMMCCDTMPIIPRNIPGDSLRFGQGIAIGLWEDEKLDIALEYKPSLICVDVADGYMNMLHRFLNAISDKVHKHNAFLMSGNVVTPEGYKALANCDVDFVRVGIGTSKVCRTRENVGVGYPQLSALDNIANYKQRKGLKSYIIADGGIRTAADALKAFACGADAVMIGSLFATCKETPHNGTISGSASKEYQLETYGKVRSNEGATIAVEKTTTVKELLDGFAWNLRHGCSYLGCSNLSEIRNYAEFVEVGRGTIK